MPYSSEQGDFEVALVGDIMPSRRLSVFQEPEFHALRDILTAADACFANLETVVVRYGEVTPSLRTGTYMLTEPELLEDLRWFGFNMVSCANSHSLNFGEEGLLAEIRYLDAARIAHAGTGANLREASSPAYRDTPNGRVALTSCTAHFPENRALHQRADYRGKPGVNPLAWETTFVVDRRAFDELVRISRALGLERERARMAELGFHTSSELGAEGPRSLGFGGATYELGERFDIRTRCDPADLEENLRQISEARRQANWVIATLHAQDSVGRAWLSAKPGELIDEQPDFVREFAHAAIDAGADIAMIHGPHTLMGIEIYDRKPIFYSLGNFILQNETLRHLPSYAYDRMGLPSLSTPMDFFDRRSGNGKKGMAASPRYWEAAVATCHFAGRELAGVTLHPVELGYGRSRPERGRPLLADPETGSEIIERIAGFSRPFGTEVELVEARGEIRLRG
jgi:poly-gamma-glutamate capsule biosynthesis protein CapA/YwtB (metallophosphatase superfamily)